MATRLNKADWNEVFARATELLVGRRAEVQVLDPILGSQIEADWLPLLGITYDPEDDMIEIALEGLEHMVNKPSTVYIDHSSGALISFQIIDADGVQRIILMRDPPMLPRM